jgi:hypothetical protein
MYFDFEDYHPDTPTIGRVISWREGVLLSIIVHLAAVIVILVFPQIFPEDIQAARARLLEAQQNRLTEQPTFVFVQPEVGSASATTAESRRVVGHRSTSAGAEARGTARQSTAVQPRQ